MVLLKEDIPPPMDIPAQRSPKGVCVRAQWYILTKPKRKAAALEPKAIADKMLGTEMAGRKGKHGQLAKHRVPFLFF